VETPSLQIISQRLHDRVGASRSAILQELPETDSVPRNIRKQQCPERHVVLRNLQTVGLGALFVDGPQAAGAILRWITRVLFVRLVLLEISLQSLQTSEAFRAERD
jgi:hypothetical protein